MIYVKINKNGSLISMKKFPFNKIVVPRVYKTITLSARCGSTYTKKN